MLKRLCFLFVLPTSLFAQHDLSLSISNYLRYGTGRETVGTFSQRKEYFENLMETRISLSDFLLGFRLLHDAPPEYGNEFTGIRKRYLEFKRDNLYLRAGDSYSLYSMGLALNLFENRGLAHDTGIDGIKFEYKTRVLEVSATGGTINYTDVLDLSRMEEYEIRAGSVELMPYQSLSVGGNFVSGKFRVPNAFVEAQFDIPELFGRIQFGNIDAFVSYADRRTGGAHTGNGFYGSIAYTDESFGVSFEYKDYRFGSAGPYDRITPNRVNKAYAFQNAPIVHKEHSFTLLTRYPHVIDFNDEVGYQLDAFYTLADRLTGSVNASAASRHYSYAQTGDTNQVFAPVYGTGVRKGSFLPSFATEYSPFWELYADVQYFLYQGGNDYMIAGFNRRSDVVNEYSSQFGQPVSSKATMTTSVPVAAQITLTNGLVAKFTSERQWVHEAANPAQTDYYNQLISLGVSRSPTYSVTIRYEFTNDYGTIDGRRNWTAVDLGFRFSDKHNITLTVGGDRGGLVCANGVCRVVNPFLGVRASILSYL